MKIAILGYDTEGRASYDYFVSKGDDVTICDQNPKLNIPKAAKAVLGDGYLANLDRFELLVRTAGMQPGKILARNPSVGPKITSHINEFFKVSPTRNIVGITGTKGKGTTSTLIAKMLEADGKPVKLGGNIGIPPLSFLADLTSKTWVILELSSFQLIDLQASPHMAVCLMVAPEHLDWHGDNNEYVTAKTQLFRYQKSDDFAIYYAVNKTSKRIATTGAAKAIPYATPPGAFIDKNDIRIDDHFICHTDELKLLGKHNLQNVCASITAVWQVTKNVGAIRQVLTSFRGLPFRLEFRVKKHDISYYNDSFASQPSATIAALESIVEKKVMIIGGYDRGLDLSELAITLRGYNTSLRKVLVIGASGDRLIQAFKEAGFDNFELMESKDMLAIVRTASQIAQTGDAVVLSPGFASFDMFKNFKERGNKFNEAVDSL